jgi:hypothetical protein
MPNSSAKFHGRALVILGLALAVSGAWSPARAMVKPLVFGGAAFTTHEKTDLDKRLDEYTIRKSVTGWEAGAGLDFFPTLGPDGSRLTDRPRWQIRLRLGVGGGTLPGTTVSGRRSVYPYQYSYTFVSKETYSYSTWTLGGFFVADVVPTAGFYVGPTLQSVRTKAKRAWTGPTECSECGNAKDKSTQRYGEIELGAYWKPTALPVRFEGYCVPARVTLSTTHILESDNWTTANFPVFKRSLGARLVYEF